MGAVFTVVGQAGDLGHALLSCMGLIFEYRFEQGEDTADMVWIGRMSLLELPDRVARAKTRCTGMVMLGIARARISHLDRHG